MAKKNKVTGTNNNDIITPTFVSEGVKGIPTDGVDRIIAKNGNDFIDGGKGKDILKGGKGNDTYYLFDDADDKIVEKANQGTDEVWTTSSYTLANHVENLILMGSQSINGTGNGLDNFIRGNYLANTLNGAGGNDTLRGEEGNDTYYVDSVQDVVIEEVNEGVDTVYSSVTYTLGSHVENLTLTGNVNISGYGNDLNNIIRGNSGNNLIDGRRGADQMYGGAGNDTYKVDSVGDRIFEYAGGGIDTVEAVGSYSLANQPHLENLTLLGAVAFGKGNDANNEIDAYDARSIGGGIRVVLEGAGGNDIIHGSNNAVTVDEIYGGNQSDELNGYAGNDRLNGENEQDTLNGGTGNDVLIGGGDSDTLHGGANDDILIGNSNRPISSQGAEWDALWGDSGRDTFVLGNGFGVFYKDDGFAILKDFNRSFDKIQLLGSSSSYRLNEGQFNSTGGFDTEIIHGGNRIALIENQVGFHLNDNYFHYV